MRNVGGLSSSTLERRPGSGSGSGSGSKINSDLSASFSVLLASRDAQDSLWKNPVQESQPKSFKLAQPTQTGIVLSQKPAIDKKRAIDLILSGDLDD